MLHFLEVWIGFGGRMCHEYGGKYKKAHHIRLSASGIMMFHGYHDKRAPVSEALAFYKCLLQAKISAQLHLFDCGHHTPIGETRALIDVFLEKMVAKSKVLEGFWR